MVAGVQPNDDRIIVEQREDREKNQAVGTLTISHLAIADDGLYECIAENKVTTITIMLVFLTPVSYTHLDVYKRQESIMVVKNLFRTSFWETV